MASETVQRLRRIERAPSDLIVTCPPQVLEFCHSAHAIANDATVLAADRDFEYIARVSDLQHEYVAPTR